MMKLRGIAASEGIAIQKAVVLDEVSLSIKKESNLSPKQEKNRLNQAIEEVTKQLESIQSKIHSQKQIIMTVIEAHKQMVNDPELYKQVERLLNEQKVTAEYAFEQVVNNYIKKLEKTGSEYFKERSLDIKDVKRRVLAALLGVRLPSLLAINEEVILVAHDLTPSMTAQLNRQYVKGFLTEIGGKTSHSVIMAQSLEIPAVVGVKDITKIVKTNDLIAVDGLTGEIIIHPREDDIQKFNSKQKEFYTKKKSEQKFRKLKSVSLDGKKVTISANISMPSDVKPAKFNGADGIGLFRTEYLFMERDQLPNEEEQYEAYASVLKEMGDKRVVIRTLDIGGDKDLPYLNLSKELNPFLGQRALRLCLSEVHLFKTLLRALLRAGAYGNLHILFPMVATLDELKQAKQILAECKKELAHEGISFADDIKVGIMVEIPSVAFLADQFAQEVDFFSIGTNDLIQYTFAADRLNEKVSYLYQPLNPAFLRMIKNIIDASHEAGIWTAMCGEMAGDDLAVSILLGLDLDEFSVSLQNVTKVRKLISKLSYDKMKRLAQECLRLSSMDEVIQLIYLYTKGES